MSGLRKHELREAHSSKNCSPLRTATIWKELKGEGEGHERRTLGDGWKEIIHSAVHKWPQRKDIALGLASMSWGPPNLASQTVI